MTTTHRTAVAVLDGALACPLPSTREHEAGSLRGTMEWFILLAWVVTFAVLLSGCSTPVPITRVVHITRHQYVPVPPSLLAPCPKADLSKLATNGDMLDALLRDQAAIDTCNGQIDAIKTLAPPPATS